jgi:hypothetical protein
MGGGLLAGRDTEGQRCCEEKLRNWSRHMNVLDLIVHPVMVD